jgi:hypothetical protein
MADLVVKDDLISLANNLHEIIDQFQGALDFQNDYKDIWGQLNANLSMGDFADNWTVHRDKMVEVMKSLQTKVLEVSEAWDKADADLAESLATQK